MAFAILGAAAGGALISGYFANQAANTQASAEQAAAGVQGSIFQQQQQALAPYYQAGYGALAQIQQNMPAYNKPFTEQDFYQNDPGYQFRLEQGQNAVNRAAAASGGVGGASYLRDLGSYSQEFASSEYQNAFNRYQQQIQNSYNRLAGVAGIGQGSLQTGTQAGTAAGQGIAGLTAGIGGSLAAGQTAIGTAINQGLGTGINAYQSQQLINAQNQRNNLLSQQLGLAGIAQNPPGTSSPY